MTEASKKRMEELALRYICSDSVNVDDSFSDHKDSFQSGYQAGMQDPDANLERIRELENSLNCMRINRDNLAEENKRLRELLRDLRNGMVNVHNLLLDYYSEEQVYWDNPNLALKKSKESLEKLKESKALSSGGE